MSNIIYRSDLDRDLTPNEVDQNFRSLDDTKTEVSVTEALAADVALLEASQAIQDEVLAQLGTVVEALDGSVTGLGNRMDAAETNITSVTDQASATQQALQLHELDNQNPHDVTAEQTGADVAGTANAVMQGHLAALNPHPEYLTPEEGDARYEAIGTGLQSACLVQVFTESGTYTKPPGAKSINLLLIGGGGGGDSGQATDPGTVAQGGKSGGGGAVFMGTLDASVVNNSVAVVIGQGGVGGAPSASATPGAGARGDDTLFGQFHCNGAMTASGSGLNYNAGMFNGAPRVSPSSTGGPSVFRDTTSVVNSAFAVGMPPGSSGAGITAAGVVSATKGPNHLSLMVSQDSLPSPNIDGADALAYIDGSSGGGGGASDTGNGMDAGHGGKYGTGGGGGGATRTGFLSGAGGDGAPGVAVITTYF